MESSSVARHGVDLLFGSWAPWPPCLGEVFELLGCHKQGSIPERSNPHGFVSFHNVRFIRGDFPISQQSHMQVTHKEGGFTQ